MNDVVIEKARDRDFLSVAALDRVAWRASENGTYIPDGEHAWRIWCEHALTYIGKTAHGEVVAALVAFPCLNQSYCLHKIMVASSQQGCGIGSRLFDALLADLDRLNADCFLTVAPTNTKALKLYRARGFTEETLVKGYYRAEEDRLVLTRRSVRASRKT